MTTTRTNHGSEIPLPKPGVDALLRRFHADLRRNEPVYRQFVEGTWNVDDPLESLNLGRRFFQQLDDLYCK